jgi:hypothetical protein
MLPADLWTMVAVFWYLAPFYVFPFFVMISLLCLLAYLITMPLQDENMDDDDDDGDDSDEDWAE